MAISNELKSRVQKMTERQGFRTEDIIPTPPQQSPREAVSIPHHMSVDPPALPRAPPSKEAVSTRRDPYLGLGVESKKAEGKRSASSAAPRQATISTKRSETALLEHDSEAR
jgi:hypothetical protein